VDANAQYEEEIQNNSKTDPMYNCHIRNIRVQMVASLLILLVNPMKNILQTLLGMFAYSKGLNETGFIVLNKFGVVCSMDLIRKHGHHWSALRNPADELGDGEIGTLKKVTIDNLNFTMKMAKALKSAIGAVKRQLNLITSQVTFRKVCSKKKHDGMEQAEEQDFQTVTGNNIAPK
jgi:hypothetical protein